MSQQVDYGIAAEVLARVYADHEMYPRPPEPFVDMIKSIFGSKIKSYRYVALTNVLAKIVNPGIHTLCLQSGADHPGAFSSRQLHEKVVAPFEFSRGDMFGLSKEVYTSQSISKRDIFTPGKTRDEISAKILQRFLLVVNDFLREDLEGLLAFMLGLGHKRLKSRVLPIRVSVGVGHEIIQRWVDSYLAEVDGGKRLAHVVAAMEEVLHPGLSIDMGASTTCDRSTKSAGDIQDWDGDQLIKVMEVKHRPLSFVHLMDGLNKARSAGLWEYHFVCDGICPADAEAIRKEIDEQTVGVVPIIHADYRKYIRFFILSMTPGERASLVGRLTAVATRVGDTDRAAVLVSTWNEINKRTTEYEAALAA